MLDFSSDYNVGAADEIIEALSKTNRERTATYGEDIYSERAKEKIRKAAGCPDARVYFLVGGTQTNKTVIASILNPFEGVVSAQTGHIATHESGAVEYTGHKVLTLPEKDGKISSRDLESLFLAYLADETREHTVKPGAVYLSHPTEYGTLYTKDELKEISDISHRYGARLFIDGARLGYGLAAETDVTLADIAAYSDVFYIGGTKVGALFGEAVVITNPDICPCFFTSIKQHGALLAKGRMLGIQFDTLFTDDLYMRLGKRAIDSAMLLKRELLSRGYELFIDSPTNQQFVILDKERLSLIRDRVKCNLWCETSDGRYVIRLVTSFMTEESEIRELLKIF